MNSPQVPFSSEVGEKIIFEQIMADDWESLKVLNGFDYHDLGAELENEADPLKVLELTTRRQTALVYGIGSGMLALLKADVMAEQARFETDFGSR